MEDRESRLDWNWGGPCRYYQYELSPWPHSVVSTSCGVSRVKTDSLCGEEKE